MCQIFRQVIELIGDNRGFRHSNTFGWILRFIFTKTNINEILRILSIRYLAVCRWLQNSVGQDLETPSRSSNYAFLGLSSGKYEAKRDTWWNDSISNAFLFASRTGEIFLECSMHVASL